MNKPNLVDYLHNYYASRCRTITRYNKDERVTVLDSAMTRVSRITANVHITPTKLVVSDYKLEGSLRVSFTLRIDQVQLKAYTDDRWFVQLVPSAGFVKWYSEIETNFRQAPSYLKLEVESQMVDQYIREAMPKVFQLCKLWHVDAEMYYAYSRNAAGSKVHFFVQMGDVWYVVTVE